MAGYKRNVKCKHPKQDCTACKDGYCIALENANFKNNKDCPFYMDQKTSKRRQIECMARLASITGTKTSIKSKLKSLIY